MSRKGSLSTVRFCTPSYMWVMSRKVSWLGLATAWAPQPRVWLTSVLAMPAMAWAVFSMAAKP